MEDLKIFDENGKSLHIGDVICSFILSKAKILNRDAEEIAVGIDKSAKTIDVIYLVANSYDATDVHWIDSTTKFN